jgi:trimethylamine--corrinoid protein Co-methyltransferase
MTDVQHSSRVGRPTFLTDEQKSEIYASAIEIISRVGMLVQHDEARALLLEAGALKGDDDHIRIPRALVERARSSAPAMIPVFGRNGELAMELGAFNCYFGTGSDLMSTWDLETGEHRPSTLDDVARVARLCDALPNFDFVMSGAYPNELDPHHAYLEEFRVMVKNTTKPLVMTAEGGEDLTVMWEAACEIRGGAAELRAKPYFTIYSEPSSPLSHSDTALDKLMKCADWGVPCIYSPAPVSGATAPITRAGHVVQGTAESLFGLVIHQLRRPGSPFLFGMGPSVLDLMTAQHTYTSPEHLLSYACIVEMAKWLELPNFGYSGMTDSPVVDVQAGVDITEVIMLSLLLGSNLNHDCGYLDFGLSGAPEQLVIIDEVVGMTRRVLGGVEVTRDTMAVDTIAEVGPGGNHMITKHMKRHQRAAQWRPAIFNRSGFSRWERDGGLDADARAKVSAKEILATQEVAPLSPQVEQSLDQRVESFKPSSEA